MYLCVYYQYLIKKLIISFVYIIYMYTTTKKNYMHYSHKVGLGKKAFKIE